MDIECPECHSTKKRNPKMKLMVSKCGHSLYVIERPCKVIQLFLCCRCETCVENKFSKGTGFCPTCKTDLKKNGFRYQIFEDPFVELEIDIRKRLLKE